MDNKNVEELIEELQQQQAEHWEKWGCGCIQLQEEIKKLYNKMYS